MVSSTYYSRPLIKSNQHSLSKKAALPHGFLHPQIPVLRDQRVTTTGVPTETRW
jgi:hypothetical protein